MAKKNSAGIVPAPVKNISKDSEQIQEVTIKISSVAENKSEVSAAIKNTSLKFYLVRQNFGCYKRGNIISDPDEIEEILNSPQARFISVMKGVL